MRCRWANLVKYLQQIWSRFFLRDEDNFILYWRTQETCKKSQKWLKNDIIIIYMKMLQNCMYALTHTVNWFHESFIFVHENIIITSLFYEITSTDNITCNFTWSYLHQIWGVIAEFVCVWSIERYLDIWQKPESLFIPKTPFRSKTSIDRTYVTTLANDTRLKSLSNFWFFFQRLLRETMFSCYTNKVRTI